MTKNKNLLFTVLVGLLLSSGFAISNKTTEVSAEATHDHTGYTLWSTTDKLPGSEGSYCLTSDVTLAESWVVPNGTTNLCLNGHLIQITKPDLNVFYINSSAVLNLFDCGSTPHYFNKDDSGLWNLASGQSTPTEYSVMGGCITGVRSEEENSSGAICCEGIGVFNMYGGNIVGNKSDLGGGVYNTSTFTMYGGNICGNVALTQGGGVYCTSLAATILTGGNITENTAAKGSGLFQKFAQCFAPGTPITMADGTRKAIEDLSIGDEVRVFDHDEGTISSAKLFDLWSYPEKHSGVMNLHFTNSIDLTVVYGHSFFEREENKYVSVTRDTVSRYVGHEFYNVDNNRWETLTGYDFVEGEVDTYVITSEYHLNAVANGMLSNEDGFYTILTNIFDYGENLKIDQEKKAQDIEKYGLYPFENIKHMSKDTYDILGGQYLSVAFGKGLVTEEYFKAVEDYYSEVDPDLFCDDTNETNVIEKSIKREKRSLDPVNPPTAGLFVGGSIKILDNDVDNLLQESSGFVNIGSGTFGGGNGVIAPNEDMTIGISLQDEVGAKVAGRFTTPGEGDYSSNFFSDSEDYAVRFNNNKTTDDYSDDYLELAALVAITNETPEDDKAKNNGYIEVAESAVKGDEVSVTVVPNAGYKLSSLIYNDGEDHYITSDLSFEMPEGEVSVSAVFEAKADQVVTIVLEEEFIYPNTPSIQEAGLYVYSNYYEKLGDGVVTVEFKPKGADDSEYTTQVPTEYGEYTVRVSVAEGTDYLAGSATKDFTYSPQVITQVGFGSLGQPVAGAVAPEKTTSMLVNTKYHETVTWDPEITTTNSDGKGIFDCGTTYTAKVTLTLKDAYKDNYVFADPEDIVLKGAGTGWTLSDDSTNKTLIYTKEFEATGSHSVSKVDGTVTCTTDGYLDAYQCETCGLYFEDEACASLIGDADAYDAWKEGDGKSSALGHDMTHHNAFAPTCTDNGSVEYWSCSKCGKNYADATGTEVLESIVDPAKGHSLTHHEAVEATCEQAGSVEYWSCSKCEKNFADETGTNELNSVIVAKLDHSMTYHGAVAPSCIEAGTVEYWSCSECGKNYADEAGSKVLESTIDPAKGHSMTHHGAVAPTCTDDGNVEYWTCSHEEDVYYADAQGNKTLSSIVDTKLGHDLIHHDGKEPTCTEVGWEAYDTCSRCDYSTYEEIPELGHDLQHHEAKAATCTEVGWEAYDTCSRCDYSTYEEIPALGHDIQHHDAKAATCTEVGWEAYDTCSRCDYTTYVEIPALGHIMTHHDAVAPTCTEDGTIAYWECSHEPGVYYANEEGTETLENIVASKVGHDPIHHDGKEATCTQAGNVEYWSCSKCGKNYSDETCTQELETVVINPHAHSMTHHDAVEATCTENGSVEYWSCSECGKNYADETGAEVLGSTVDPAKGHSMTHHEAVDATCEQAGNVEYWSCSKCGKNFADESGLVELDSVVIDRLDHAITHHDAKAATCTEVGWEAYDTCSRCDYTTYVEIPALGHGVSLVDGLDPTHENDGYKPAYKCSICGEYFEDEAKTKLIGDETAYNAWKANAGHLEKLVKEETGEPAKDNTGLIVGLSLGLFFLLLLIIYLIGYIFLYRKGKLDDKKIRVIYKILPRGEENLEEDEKSSKSK